LTLGNRAAMFAIMDAAALIVSDRRLPDRAHDARHDGMAIGITPEPTLTRG
jgi:hypothetical protein